MPGGEQGTGTKFLTSLDTEDSTELLEIVQWEKKKRGLHGLIFRLRVLWIQEVTLCNLFVICKAETIYNPDVQSNMPLSRNRVARSKSLQNAQYAKYGYAISADPQNSAQWPIVQSGWGSYSKSLVLLLILIPPRQVFHSPSELVPAKLRSASISLLNFHPSLWMISPVVPLVENREGGVLFFFSFLSDIVCLLCHLVWKEPSQSATERWVKWSPAESILGSFAWWGEIGHRCQFLHRQADALRTRDAFLSISPSNQCNLCLVICCTGVLAGEKHSEKETQQ